MNAENAFNSLLMPSKRISSSKTTFWSPILHKSSESSGGLGDRRRCASNSSWSKINEVHAETRSTRRESNLHPSALSAPPREKKSGWQTRCSARTKAPHSRPTGQQTAARKLLAPRSHRADWREARWTQRSGARRVRGP